MGLRVQRAPGANVLSTLEEVKQAVAELREGPLQERGLGIEQSFDASLFIKRAVNLLIENLVVGGGLALYFWASGERFLSFSVQFLQERVPSWFYFLPFLWLVLLVELYDIHRAGDGETPSAV